MITIPVTSNFDATKLIGRLQIEEKYTYLLSGDVNEDGSVSFFFELAMSYQTNEDGKSIRLVEVAVIPRFSVAPKSLAAA
jgi:hypothetical protein